MDKCPVGNTSTEAWVKLTHSLRLIHTGVLGVEEVAATDKAVRSFLSRRVPLFSIERLGLMREVLVNIVMEVTNIRS
jgi:hypothetical protein